MSPLEIASMGTHLSFFIGFIAVIAIGEIDEVELIKNRNNPQIKFIMNTFFISTLAWMYFVISKASIGGLEVIGDHTDYSLWIFTF